MYAFYIIAMHNAYLKKKKQAVFSPTQKKYTRGWEVTLEITLETVENDWYHRENRARRHVWPKSHTEK